MKFCTATSPVCSCTSYLECLINIQYAWTKKSHPPRKARGSTKEKSKFKQKIETLPRKPSPFLYALTLGRNFSLIRETIVDVRGIQLIIFKLRLIQQLQTS